MPILSLDRSILIYPEICFYLLAPHFKKRNEAEVEVLQFTQTSDVSYIRGAVCCDN